MPCSSDLDTASSKQIRRSIAAALNRSFSHESSEAKNWNGLDRASIEWLRKQAINPNQPLEMQVAIALALDHTLKDPIEESDRLAALLFLLHLQQMKGIHLDQESPYHEIRKVAVKTKGLELFQYYLDLRLRLHEGISAEELVRLFESIPITAFYAPFRLPEGSPRPVTIAVEELNLWETDQPESKLVEDRRLSEKMIYEILRDGDGNCCARNVAYGLAEGVFHKLNSTIHRLPESDRLLFYHRTRHHVELMFARFIQFDESIAVLVARSGFNEYLRIVGAESERKEDLEKLEILSKECLHPRDRSRYAILEEINAIGRELERKLLFSLRTRDVNNDEG